jgi:IS30 family transposase
MKRSNSSISDEIKKNSVKNKYDPDKANHKSYVKRHKASFRSRKIVMNKKLRKFVENKLCDNQSPEAISGRLKYQEKDLPYVSKNTIYDFLDSDYGKLIKKKRKKIKYKKRKLKCIS